MARVTTSEPALLFASSIVAGRAGRCSDWAERHGCGTQPSQGYAQQFTKLRHPLGESWLFVAEPDAQCSAYQDERVLRGRLRIDLAP